VTPEPASLDRLLHLVDRAERGALLPAEAAQLRAHIRGLHDLIAAPIHEVSAVAELAALRARIDEVANMPADRCGGHASGVQWAIRMIHADSPGDDETPTETAAADRRYWTTRYDKETR
jgi:hypothetical protein